MPFPYFCVPHIYCHATEFTVVPCLKIILTDLRSEWKGRCGDVAAGKGHDISDNILFLSMVDPRTLRIISLYCSTNIAFVFFFGASELESKRTVSVSYFFFFLFADSY